MKFRMKIEIITRQKLSTNSLFFYTILIPMDSLLANEWTRLEETSSLLEPFAVSTDVLQTDAQSLSNILPSLLDLECHLQQFPPLVSNMLKDLQSRMRDILDPESEIFDPLPASASLLNPTIAKLLLVPDMAGMLRGRHHVNGLDLLTRLRAVDADARRAAVGRRQRHGARRLPVPGDVRRPLQPVRQPGPLGQVAARRALADQHDGEPGAAVQRGRPAPTASLVRRNVAQLHAHARHCTFVRHSATSSHSRCPPLCVISPHRRTPPAIATDVVAYLSVCMCACVDHGHKPITRHCNCLRA